ncbi:spindle orientation adaptor protein inscuteable [Oratosquilla oratoria]|uniref:spindle orientation adaptor protein inscuteable n=1 Tax=Oratosquilla oratoria TaxID=337810 RepID=UPI003F773478
MLKKKEEEEEEEKDDRRAPGHSILREISQKEPRKTINKGLVTTSPSPKTPQRPNDSFKDGDDERTTAYRGTPFKRGRSRVYYASDNGCWSKEEYHTRRLSSSSSSRNDLTPHHETSASKWRQQIRGGGVGGGGGEGGGGEGEGGGVGGDSSNKNDVEDGVERQDKMKQAPIVEAEASLEETSSSGEDGNQCEDSPLGSFRVTSPFRGSPSHRSQDSGYSDSSESHSGGHNDSDGGSGPVTPPQVKHITRVYFGSSDHDTSCAKLYNDKIVCTPTPSPPSKSTPVKVEERGKKDVSKSPDSNVLSAKYSNSSRGSSNNSSCSSTTSSVTPKGGSILKSNSSPCGSSPGSSSLTPSVLEEPGHLLEHKDVLGPIKNAMEVTMSRKTGAIRKKSFSSAVLTPGKPRTRRSHSVDKLVAESFAITSPIAFSSSNVTSTPISHAGSSLANTCSSEPRERRRPPFPKARRRWSTTDSKDLPPRSQSSLEVFGPKRSHRDTSEHRHQQRAFKGTIDRGTTTERGLQTDLTLLPTGSHPSSLDALDDPLPASRHAAASASHLGTSRDFFVKSREFSSLPRNLNKSQKRRHPLDVARQMGNSAIQRWAIELRGLYEAECMNTLQSKAVGADTLRLVAAGVSSSRDAVRAVQHRAHLVSTEFAKLCQRLECLHLRHVPALAQSLVGHISTFLSDYTAQWTATHPRASPQSSLGQQTRVIEQICRRLSDVCSKELSSAPATSTPSSSPPASPSSSPSHEERLRTYELDQEVSREIVKVVTALGHAFTKLVDIMLSREIKVLVTSLEDPKEESGVRAAISNVTALGLDGGHMCRLISRLGGVRALLLLCLDPRWRGLRVAVLRALATVCCVAEGIKEFEKCGGVEVLCDVLCDSGVVEEERSEAAGVLAQITSPWVESNHPLSSLRSIMSRIVKALSDLTSATKSSEIFLLASAALANLTFLDGGCASAMREANTARVLIRGLRRQSPLSVFTMDQVATVLANLASTPEVAEDVLVEGGVDTLVGLLEVQLTASSRLPEVAATERVQQKSAIAISRLCGCSKGTAAARRVLELGGVRRLVNLCRDEQARNHSDSVLVACLAALRKIASISTPEDLRQLNAPELLEPRLLDSFLIYSSRQESYV